jgi:hypothetical protein
MFDGVLLGRGMMRFISHSDGLGVDGFRNGLLEMVNTKKVPAWLVFATENFLDIQHILKDDISRGSQELQWTYSIIRHRLQQHLDALGPLAALDRSDNEDCERFERYRDVLFTESFQVFQTHFILHPVGAGLREFFTIAWLRQIGVACLSSSDVVAAAHLYQVAQIQSQYATWPDTEFVIETHTSEHIFFGGPPITFEQCCLKYALALEFSVQNHNALMSMPKPPVMSGHGRRLLSAGGTPFTNLLYSRGNQSRHVTSKEQQKI